MKITRGLITQTEWLVNWENYKEHCFRIVQTFVDTEALAGFAYK